MTCDYWGIMSPQPIFTARFRRLISLIPAERFLFPDLYGICHHHSYENRVWMWMAGEGSFPPAPQSGLASVSPTSSTWTQLTPHIPFLPSLQEAGMAPGRPSCGTANATSHGSQLTHKPWMALPTEQDLPAQGVTGTPVGLGRRPSNLQLAEGKETETSPQMRRGHGRSPDSRSRTDSSGGFPT